MAYISARNRPNPLALAGALAVPAAVGAVLVVGLAVTAVIETEEETFTGWNVPKVPEPEPLPDPEPSASEKASTTTSTPARRSDPVLTRPESKFDFRIEPTTPIGSLPSIADDGVGTLDPLDFGVPKPAPSAGLDPVAAAPRGNPGRWITDRDYRSIWINRGYEGVAGFTLSIDANGRVGDCTITRSTGHGALDDATCRLLKRNARFDPAKDGSGDAVAGTYASSVTWQIPGG